ncbi:MAG: universal stress protein [Arenimonas sp.]
MFKDLLVATTRCGDDAAAVATAIALAEEFSAHLAVLVQVQVHLPAPNISAMGVFSLGDFGAAIETAQQLGAAERDRWIEVLQASGVSAEVRLDQAFPASLPGTAAMHALYCDLAVIGLDGPDSLPGPLHEQFAKLLLSSGRPVLAVPRGWVPCAVRRVVVGWHPGVPAARAVHDALPWLSRAGNVDIVCVDPRGSIDGHGEEPGADIATHLARHGVKVTVHGARAEGRDPGAVLLERGLSLGAELIVAGGYGHSRLREWALGGTTRYLLQNSTLPVLFSH